MKTILYSPWRLKYILAEKDKTCIFCLKQNKEEDIKNLILYRSNLCYVIMNTFPYNNGHLLVVPNRHVSNLNSLSQEECNDLFSLVRLTEEIITKVYHPDGLNIGLNLGKAAGAGIDDHLHVHIVPRWLGDANFMTSISGSRVIPEAFERTYKLLKEQFDNETTKK